MTLSAGTRLGPYEIVTPLGAGGMGEVYRARDSRLDRDVAIKVLPDSMTRDADRITRFEREAKVLASLNHPNIGAIHGFETAEARKFLVLEYVEGETLAQRLKAGALPIDEALEVSKQIAEALEAAHERGIVHRDLKPGNVMVRPDGTVKVLDFGLARAMADDSTNIAGISDSPTVTTPVRACSPTIPGVIMGTAGYMSPEQARGKPVDKRSDIFSFGCVFYEMLTGRQPFTGETITDSLGAILHREPEWTLIPQATPPRIRELLDKCLAKDRKNRVRDIGDARLDIERAISGREWVSIAHAARRPGAKLALALLVGVGTVGLVGGTWLIASRGATRSAQAHGTVRMLVASQTSTYFSAANSVISPDGQSIVFSAWGVDRPKPCLWVRPLDSYEARPLPETEDARFPFWSPDSRSVAFFADGKLWAVEISQRGSRRLIAAETGSYGADWGKDGSIIFSRAPGDAQLMRIPPAGGSPEPLTSIDPTSPEKAHVFPRFLPDGQRYLYVGVVFDPNSEVRIGHLYAGRIGSNERTLIGNMLSSVWYVEPGWLVYVEDATVKAVPFDPNSLKITGESTTVADGAYYFRGYGGSTLSVARDGTIAYEPPGDDQQLVWFDSGGKRLETLGPKGRFSRMRISPDGSQVAVGMADRRTSLSDLWLFGTARATAKHLTTDAREEATPIWSRDGSHIYFSWDRRSAPEVFKIRSDGSGEIEDVYGPDSGGGIWYAMDVTPDDTSLIVSGSFEKLGREFRIVPLDRNGEAAAFRSSIAHESGARFAPNGKWVAYVSDESGKQEVYLAPYPGPGAKVQISENGGSNPLWSPEGNKIYYRRAVASEGLKDGERDLAAMMVVDLDSPEAFRSPPRPRVLFETQESFDHVDIAPDGKRFLAVCKPRETPPIHVVLNSLPRRP